MALKPTIFKLQLDLADSDRHLYQTFPLTLAQHPSETAERLVARVLAFALNAHEALVFTKGLSTDDEPDLWQKTLDDQIEQWIEVGQPKPERLKKALNQARAVKLYPFGKAADTWWQLEQKNLPASERLQVAQFRWADMVAVAQQIERTMHWSVSVAGGELYVDTGAGQHHLTLQPLAVAG